MCWKEDFQKVLNRGDPETNAVIKPATEKLDINTSPPTSEEVQKAIKSLKMEKLKCSKQKYKHQQSLINIG